MELFRFANSEYLYALIIVPVLILLFIVTRIIRRRALTRFARPGILEELMPSVSNTRPVIKFILWILALSAVILAFARPQFGS
ncbi:MAG: BatA domain-containing protein, partial [Mangrovibacterium sp.]